VIGRRGRRNLTCFAAAALAIAAAACTVDSVFGIGASTNFAAGTTQHGIDVGSLTRTYLLHVPARRGTSTSGTLLPYPLVIMLHGSSATGSDIEHLTNMDSIADVRHWIVAYPNGERGAGGLFPSDWNAGSCCGAAGREGVDDVGFITALIAQLSTKLPMDKRRIYVAGFSDGARLAYHLGCTMSAKLAAIGVVSGSLTDGHCAPATPLPVVGVHGTNDPTVAYSEPSLTPLSRPVTGVGAQLPPSAQFWLTVNGCSVGVANQTVDITHTTFTGCTGANVSFYTLTGGVHAWPVLVPGATGASDSELSASVVIADFFSRHVR
jgi:polyhydroxybutyrate depolymerase